MEGQQSATGNLGFKEKCRKLLAECNYKEYGMRMMKFAKKNSGRLMVMSDVLLQEKQIEELMCAEIAIRLLLQECLLYAVHDDEFQNGGIFEKLVEKHKCFLLAKREDNNQTVLHLAVAGRKHEAVKMILKKVKELMILESQDEKVSAFHEYLNSGIKIKEITAYDKTDQEQINIAMRYEGTCMGAEVPLLMAVWNLDEGMVEILLDNKADVTKCNSKHENVFHVLVQVAGKKDGDDTERKSRTECVERIFDLLVKKIKAPYKKGDSNKGRIELSKLLNQKNSQFYTPLCLSAKLLAGDIYQKIISCEVYKQFDEAHGACNEYFYDIQELDSALGEDSLMRIVACQKEEEYSGYCLFTDRSPLIDMIRLKWQAYRLQFYTWGVIHLLLSIIPIVYFSMTKSDGKLYTAYNTTETQVADALDTSLVVYHIYGHIILVMELIAFLVRIVNTCKKHSEFTIIAKLQCCNDEIALKTFKYQNFWSIIRDSFSTAGNRSFQVMLWIFGILSVISLSMLSTGHEQSFIPLALYTVAGWSFLLQFIRFFKVFSYFTVILYRALLRNLIQLAVVYMLFLIPFGAAMTAANFSHSSASAYTVSNSTSACAEIKSDFQDFSSSLYTLFHTSIGLADISSLECARHPQLATMIYIAHSIITYVLLFNILIALLSETAVTFSQRSTIDSMWYLQKLNIILFVEDHLLIKNRKKCGKEKRTDLFPEEKNTGNPEMRQIFIPMDQSKVSNDQKNSNSKNGGKKKSHKRYLMEIREVSGSYIRKNGVYTQTMISFPNPNTPTLPPITTNSWC